MKQISLIIFSCLLGQFSSAQSDSVYFSISTKLIPKIQIITPHGNGNTGTREKYNKFKGRYWKGETDTVSMSIVTKGEIKKSRRAKIEYEKHGVCDSIINIIRNSVQYSRLQSQLEKVARQEIGYDNDEFKKISYSRPNRIKDFSKMCQDEFKIEIFELKKQLLKEIQRIKTEKEKRRARIEVSPEMNSTEIASFLKIFDTCDIDLKSLELIILKYPVKFMNSINMMSESDFFSFTFKLDNFSQNSNISKMKESLKNAVIKGKRKRKIIRKIKS